MIKRLIKRTAGSSILQHILFWVVAWYIMLKLFSNSSETSPIDYIYTSVFLVTVALAVYINLLVFIPLLLEKRKYGIYLLFVIFSTGIVAWLNMILFSDLIDYLLPGYYFISYYYYQALLTIFFSFIILTTLLELSKGWFRLAETRNELTRIEKEHAQAELLTLKNQINPHFLFNSLNSLYSLVVTKSAGAPAYILELSGFLRYILYETSTEQVQLDKELQSISSYIEIQKLRKGQGASVTFEITGDSSGKMIAPLLFLPLVENAFKHGIPEENAETFVQIKADVSNNEVRFSVINSAAVINSVAISNSADLTEKPASGIGITNLKRRLQRLYPDSHTINIEHRENQFRALLIVPLQYEAQMHHN